MALVASNSSSALAQSAPPGQTQLADAWATFCTSVPATLNKTTEQLKDLARVSAQSAIRGGVSLASGPAGAVMSATVAEIAGHVIENQVYELTNPLQNTSLSGSIRERLRSEIHNQASNVLGTEASHLKSSGEPDLGHSSPNHDPTTQGAESQKKSSPLEELFSSSRRWEKEVADKRRGEQPHNHKQILPHTLKLF